VLPSLDRLRAFFDCLSYLALHTELFVGAAPTLARSHVLRLIVASRASCLVIPGATPHSRSIARTPARISCRLSRSPSSRPVARSPVTYRCYPSSSVPRSQVSVEFLSNSRLCQDPLPQGTASSQVTSDCASESRPIVRPPIVFVARNLYEAIACAEPALDRSHALRLIIIVRTSLPTVSCTKPSPRPIVQPPVHSCRSRFMPSCSFHRSSARSLDRTHARLSNYRH
jgi:hypothetical protein